MLNRLSGTLPPLFVRRLECVGLLHENPRGVESDKRDRDRPWQLAALLHMHAGDQDALTET
ncbi:hypothetical protein AWB91_23065 [Mycobacterium paraense]|uniref:Uncharacterized protein n=1 Tax=Mycobacterium paraense TaxID=767916 RepID=A0ABX3VJL7_9MYCO|nr:hypothetical protein AWB91_23065 [Mycobacterium paraense]ORW35032.1 hypothetical protein AWB88_27280 [Mycobacterium paraense]